MEIRDYLLYWRNNRMFARSMEVWEFAYNPKNETSYSTALLAESLEQPVPTEDDKRYSNVTT